MKIVLKLSIAANIGLVALVIWLAQRPRPALPDGVPVETAASAKPQLEFNWRQLESTDYRTYIANLKAIGCPLQTIRDIIVADVDSVYAGRRKELMRRQSGSSGGPNPADRKSLESGLQQLQSEEAAVLLSLLGPPPGYLVPVASDVAPPLSPTPPTPVRRSRFQDQRVVMPLVFQNPGSELTLNSTQISVINDLRETFTQELREQNLDPASPEYRQRWLKAQREADDMMSAMLGGEFVINYQLQVADQTTPGQ